MGVWSIDALWGMCGHECASGCEDGEGLQGVDQPKFYDEPTARFRFDNLTLPFWEKHGRQIPKPGESSRDQRVTVTATAP